ncbi:chemotaxis protein CheY [Thioploca ingrica]|uniref:Chemotaxis protein CheY n=1 Tax=Thioploca ingrica TaxID=40754 RepID=A0A090AKC3_9GAMM|nr:chemotaxis protein CheY [Thioploca ingrica]
MKLRVMLIDDNRGRAALLQQALRDAHYEVVAVLHDDADILKRVQETPVDVILIDLESPDRDTLEYLSTLNRESPKPIVMFAENDDNIIIQAAIKAGVSAYVVDGLSHQRLKPIMKVAIARFREYQAMRAELDKTRNQLAERKVIERAKGIVMKQKGIDEASAYHALRKMAMDRNLRLAEVAESVIAVTQLLE